MTHNPYQSPHATDEPAPEERQITPGVSREGDRLVMPLNTHLPHRCIKCNTSERLVRKRLELSYLPPRYLWTLPLVIPYIVAAVRHTRRATVHYSICDRDCRRRLTARVALFLVIVIVVAWPQITAGYLALTGPTQSPFVHTIMNLPTAVRRGLIMFFFLVQCFLYFSYVVHFRTAKITDQEATIVGPCEAFLATFPEASIKQ